MGANCSNCQYTRTEQDQHQIVIKKMNKQPTISQSRLSKMPSKQQTLAPLNYELGNQEDDQDLQFFENQFVSIQKTATFHSNNPHQLHNDQKSIQSQKDDLLSVKKVEESKQTLIQSSNNKPIENPIQITDIQVPQSPINQYSCPRFGNSQKQTNDQLKTTSAKNLEEKPIKQNLKVGNEKRPPLERKNTNKSLQKEKRDKSFNEAQSMKAQDRSDEDLTPTKKGILKNKGYSYSRAKSLYSREKSQDNISCKSSCSKKRVKFDPKTYRQKQRNFMFV